MLTYPRTPRAVGHETLDSAAPDSSEASEEFRFLRKMNRVTAASDALLDAIEWQVKPTSGDVVSVGDFGTGAGDIVTDAVLRAPTRGFSLAATLTDHADEALRHARETAVGVPDIRFATFDLLADDPAATDGPFDVAHTSLVLHHFTDEGVVQALRRMSLCSRKLVVWNDLIRDSLGILGARAATMFSGATLRHDAELSVRRSFTLSEARAFAEAAGLLDIEVKRWRGARFVLTARPPSTTGPFPSPRPMVRARGLAFAFGNSVVFRDRSLLIRSGEVGLAAGPNGSGKTTMLRLLAGVLRPLAGDAWCDTCEGPIGFLPQQGGLIASLTIESNLDMLQRVAAVPPSERERRAREAVARFGLESLLSRPVSQLSIGQARRAALATIWATTGSVLLLDEPDAGLDPDGRERLGLALVEHARAGGAALIASHEWSWLDRACSEGRIAQPRSIVL